METILNLVLGATLSLISLLIGYQLGKHQRVIPEEARKAVVEAIRTIQNKTVSNDIGAVARPNQEQLDRFKNPQLAQEEALMQKTFEELNK